MTAPIRCDVHDVELVRDPVYYGWRCPVGDARYDDEDAHRLLGPINPAQPRVTEIRVTGCHGRQLETVR